MTTKLLLAGASALVLLGVAVPASAQSMFSTAEPYGSIGYTQFRVDEIGEDTDVEDAEIDFGAVTARFGAKFTPNVGVEGEVQVGVDDSEDSAGGVTVSLGLNYAAHVFAVGYLPVSPRADLFARIGVGVTDVAAEVRGGGFDASESESETTFAYGAGGQFFFDDANGVRAEYTRYDGEDDTAEADSLSLSYVRKF